MEVFCFDTFWVNLGKQILTIVTIEGYEVKKSLYHIFHFSSIKNITTGLAKSLKYWGGGSITYAIKKLQTIM